MGVDGWVGGGDCSPVDVVYRLRVGDGDLAHRMVVHHLPRAAQRRGAVGMGRSSWRTRPGCCSPRIEERHSSARRVCRTTPTRQNYDPPPPPPKVYLRTETECFDDGTCIETDIYEDPTGGATVPAPPPSWVESEVCTQVRKDDPVIKTWYTFERPEWTSISPIVASGSDRSPYWPQMETSPILRESSRSQTLSVYFKDQDDGSLSVFHPPASDFGMYLPGLSLPVSRNWWGISSVTFPTDDDE